VPYVREAGLGVAAGRAHRRFDLVLGSAITIVPCLLDWRRAFASLLIVLLIVVVVGAIARWRIGGATGDVYGATTELSQLGALVVFAAHL
jgi:adenosylcobinamide-GDP ribazoletransferase